ncbi:hypothetical protein RGQ13_11640 [Thalassotalea psychrophila]|uniref:DUF4468 domain-containing protein n=1 Tax=Thalassotalea psychrophila TaxID=3065647 RepID=A0ABY9TR29_9GAMM|nr:hypothetical protein RGQ13_11640 [Colwelliaceae bacterium SQ149]
MNILTNINKAALLISILFLVTSCSGSRTPKDAFAMNSTQVEVRSYQTRAYDTTDKVLLLRSVIATLQDLEFIIDKADVEFGVVSATKLNRYSIRMTITIRERGEHQLLVRANAHYNLQSIEDPTPYQDFYAALNKSTFLTSHEVD